MRLGSPWKPSRRSINWAVIFALTLVLFLVGCASHGSGAAWAASLSGRFQVTLEDRVDDSVFQMVKLRIQAASADMMQVEEALSQARSVVPLSRSDSGRIREGHVILAALLLHNEPLQPGSRYQVYAAVESRGVRSHWQGGYDLGSATRLEEIFSVSITNGTYLLDHSLVIATRHGQAIRLTVGRWN